MAIDLQKLVKGQRIGIGLSKVSLGLGWDPNQGSGDAFDLDASAFLLDANGKVPQDEFFVFYNNPTSPDGAVESSGDDTTGGSSDGDDETLTVDLTKIDPRVQSIVFTVTIHEYEARRQNFGQVRNSFIRIYDTEKGDVIAKYELEEDFSVETAVEFGRLYKKDGAWKFEAMGIGYKGGLEYFLSKYV